METDPVTLPAPSLRRRAACLLYELVILFGVGLIPAVLSTGISRLIGPGLTQQLVIQVIGFLSFGTYFVWMWRHGGQTLPMQTWRIRLVTAAGQPLSTALACKRYLLCWLWVAPPMLAAYLAGWHRWWALGATAAWATLYGAWAWIRPQRQFLHDVLCGTRLVQLPR